MVAVAAIIAGALGAVVVINRQPSSPTARSATAQAGAARPTVPQEIMERHAGRDGQLDVEGALELFSYAFTPLPGVSLPSGASDQPADWADTAIRSVLNNWSELTVAQRQVVLSYLNTSPPASTPSAAARAATTTAPTAQLSVYHPETGSTTLQQQLQVKVQQALKDEAAKLGHTLAEVGITNPNTAVQAVVATVEYQNSQGQQAGAWTWATSGPVTIDPTSSAQPGALSGKPTACYIYFPPSFWKNLTWVPGSDNYDTLYHEVFHCYQAFVLGQEDLSVFYAAPDWVIEGSAEWAGDSMSGSDDYTWPDLKQTGQTTYGYLNNPRTGLNAESHEAFGLFYEIEYLGRPLWPVWWGIWDDASVGGWGTSDWLGAVAGDQMKNFTDAWGSSFFVDAGLGHDWTETASNQTTAYQNVAPAFSGSLAVTAVPYSTYQEIIPSQGAGTVVLIVTSAGTARYIDGAGHEGVGDQDVALCWGDCSKITCTPTGSGPPPGVVEVTGTVHWALTALTTDGGIAQLTEVTSSSQCPTPKTSPPCSWGCAGSNGDPHLTTVDSRRYDFQAAGEYVLLRSPDGSLEIQGRQEPLAGENGDYLNPGPTTNSAVAARVGSHRVGVYVVAGHLQVRVDGSVVAPTSPVDLGNGAQLAVHTQGVEVDFPDGTQLWALPLPPYGINIQVRPSAALRSTGEGVLGVVPPGRRYPSLPDGSGFPYNVTAAQDFDFRYQQFGPAWRVTDQDTLFDYDPGKSTSSYAYPGFAPLGTPPSAARLAAAEAACAQVTNVELYDACVYDVATSGDTAFAAGYLSTQSFQQKGTPALDQGSTGSTPTPTGSTPTPTDSTPGPTALASPAVPGRTDLLAGVDHVLGSVLGSDGTLYATIDLANPSGLVTSAVVDVVAIDPATAAITHRAAVGNPSGKSGLVEVAGSLWFVTESVSQSCSIDRVDPATLQTQATIPLQTCPPAFPDIAGAGGFVWTYAPGTSQGQGELLRFDPSTNAQAGSVTVPAGQVSVSGGFDGFMSSSDTSLFWGNLDTTYRVQAPWTSPVDLQTQNLTGGFPSGDNLIFGTGLAASVYGGSGGQQASIALNGPLDGADAQNIYVEQQGASGNNELWRVPITSGSPAEVASWPAGATAPWNTGGEGGFFVTSQDVLALDIESPSSGQGDDLYLLAAPLA
jgi:hypothetical protein